MKPATRSEPPGAAWTLRRLAAAVALLLALPAAARPAAAQTGEVGGTVVAAGSNRPLAGAQVAVQGTDRRAVTDAAGRFRIGGLSGTEVTLRATTLGYQGATRTARVGDTGVRLELNESAIALNAVVVTGTGVPTERRALGNAVGRIDAAQVTREAPITSVQSLLNGRAPGVVIQPGTGAVGTGARIRIRGASSFSLSNEPLVYVDGVRINSTAATGPANQAFGSSTISRINDINPEDIQSIEVLRGPAAATLYGTEASNGVIQIITKKGSTGGGTQWSVNVRQGANFLSNPEGRFWVNWGPIPAAAPTASRTLDTVPFDIVERENARGTPIFRTGHQQQYDLAVSGGTDKFRYYASGGYENGQGAEASNDTRRYTTRLNLTVAPNPRLSFDAGMGYTNGLTHLSAEAGFGGRVWSTVLASPSNTVGALAHQRGFHSGTPEEYDALYNFSQGINRFIGSLQVNHRPFGWFQHRLSVGADFTREDNITFLPRIDSLISNPVFGSEALGSKEITNGDIRYRTIDYSGTASFDLTPRLTSKTTFGGQYYRTKGDTVYAYGEVFPAPGLTAIDATTSSRVNNEYSLENAELGFFGQEQLGWNDRLFFTFGLRTDDNSAFGTDFDRVYYPKASASWVVSEEPFFHLPFLNTLLLRAAYGEAGKQPPTFAAQRTFAPAIGTGDQPAVTPQFLGNATLGPERGKELELGFDAGFLDDRAGIEVTYYNKRVEGAILEREIAPSIGFFGTQFFNAGQVKNWGWELSARGRPVDRRNVGLDLNLSVATNSNRIVTLGLPGLTSVTAGSFLEHREGYAIGSFFEQRVLSAELNAAGQATNVMCDNGDGGSMLCTGADGRYGTADDAPNVFLGRSLPKVEGAFSSTLTLFRNWRVYGLLDFKTGMKKVDGNTRVRCTFFGRCEENYYPARFDPVRIAQIQSSRNLVDFLIQDASFAKLREVSLTYALPELLARRAGAQRASLSLAGRNLATWTNYPGLEPEAMFLGGTRGGNFGAFEQTTLPQLTSWIVSLNLTF
ncbi:SusC/RagA family TonB-linked outer membrane protein [Longimicrobium sp.]|uniref:SusC/RagA family TonB-linked outer membrane protein n=1 Tax=Longimicrobium sp. TaxID=2029185 RepID=UPI002C9989A7|nr:SusC/RagA family TonB-linked outer membrane protein [Longimicrobium sp.]HSU16381.1 SusC/RagA family TonB-linked outer membrane protein [Longimicrobium sp.]